jgi:hypothetical protein
MNPRRFLMGAVAACTLSTVPAIADNAVLFWNQQVINATRLSRNPPPVAALHFATFHVAIADAVNGIAGQWQPWLVREKAPAGADMDAAIAGAAYVVLDELFGKAANPYNFNTAYDQALAAIPDGPAKTDGLAWGKHVAELVLAERAKTPLPPPEGSYTSTDPGKWRETPPGFRPPVTPRLSEVKPFVLNSSSQFRAPPPHTVDSKEYAEEIAYVNKVGPRDGAERTEYQTLSTPFWSDDLGSATPPGHWNVIAQDLARRRNLGVVECARLFALLNMAGADSGIACWETKYFYRTWRPETALREIDAKVNPTATANPDFIPNMASPAFPSYTSGHSTYTAAMSHLLELYFGTDDIEFTVTSDGLPGAVRTYKKLSDARREVGMSRVWGGIHVMSDNLEGQKAGLKVADWVFSHALQPVQ